MKKVFFLVSVLIIAVTIMSCKKEEVKPKADDPLLFIRGKFGNETFLYEFPADIKSRYESYGEKDVRNQLHLQMKENVDEGSPSFLIQLYRFDLPNITFPWVINSDITYPKPYAIMSYLQPNVIYESSQLAGRDMFIRIDKIDGDTLSGVFNGEFYHSNIRVNVTDGEFKVLFERKNY